MTWMPVRPRWHRWPQPIPDVHTSRTIRQPNAPLCDAGAARGPCRARPSRRRGTTCSARGSGAWRNSPQGFQGPVGGRLGVDPINPGHWAEMEGNLGKKSNPIHQQAKPSQISAGSGCAKRDRCSFQDWSNKDTKQQVQLGKDILFLVKYFFSSFYITLWQWIRFTTLQPQQKFFSESFLYVAPALRTEQGYIHHYHTIIPFGSVCCLLRPKASWYSVRSHQSWVMPDRC